MSAKGEEILAFRHASRRFGAVEALADCSFGVRRGRMLGFLGPNGAGKTTAMRAIFGLLELDGGELLWGGRPIGLPERLRFGYMPEERGLYPRMRVCEQLEYFGCLHGLTAVAARTATRRWLERLEPRRPRGRQGRGALARQPAARPARGGVAARTGSPRPR